MQGADTAAVVTATRVWLERAVIGLQQEQLPLHVIQQQRAGQYRQRRLPPGPVDDIADAIEHVGTRP